jgi:hypothetical protein
MTADANAFAALRRFVRKREDLERCDLCAAPVAAAHRHLFDPAERRLVCACAPCVILFAHEAATRFRPVPERVRALPGLALSDAAWDRLMIPINVAFFVRSSADHRVRAFYPSPAGATESLLDLELWPEVEMENDVEALLVNRLRAPGAAYVVPIDRCFHLVGLIRTRWRGLSGGTEAWKAVGQFFEELHA